MSRRVALSAALVPFMRSGFAAERPEVARIVNGFAAGGGADTICRQLASAMGGSYAKPVIVDVRAGAGGQIAVQYVKGAVPDGTTLLLIPMFTLGIRPHTYKKVAYDPFTDLAPVSLAVKFEYAVTVGPSVPASVTNVPQLMAWFKLNPGVGSLGYPGVGSTAHFIGVSLAKAAGVEVAHVGYKGGQPAILDMIGGQIPGTICQLGEVNPYVKSGKCRLLATSGPQRSSFVPTVPTLAEEGYKELVVNEWFGIYLPAGAKPGVVERLNLVVRSAVFDPGFSAALLAMGFTPAASSPQELPAMLQADSQRWGDLVKAIGFTADA